ncbi:hypothetical protein OB919_08405 [Halobacteria archaeon AArc-curdl1]|uniref:Uncharacterized protein n=1 Tax=Natronosalvus hydrolyticus TaxID=2979988 RepID=A0AAP2Z848_9EURY|nr:hypothetical protein [Halobacteria archaeon AArc-curdl1]
MNEHECEGKQSRSTAKPTPRATVEYGPDGVTVHGMSDRVDEDDAPIALEVFRQVTSQRLPDEPFGHHRATVHHFAHVIVVHYPYQEDATTAEADAPKRGVVATFDAEEAEQPLTALIEATARASR